ncbi:MAG TPA: serine hydrolase domain-containing protein [Allosphingosinicella sp.]|nr:serine hydrolase domain-containing protein [Allosphingosinicella sp.]
MLRRLLLLTCLLALPAAPAAAEEDRIDRLFTAYMAREKVPGAVLVVLRGDEVAISRAWGVADRASGAPMPVGVIQPIYSASKQFTAATLLRLVEQGRVALDAPVGRYLPEYFADEPALEVRHLLRHASGLANFVGRPEARALEQAAPGTGSIADMVALADRLPRRFTPGARHAYSNSNYTALALIVERVTGQPYAEAQRELLLVPLGLAGIDECAARERALISPGHDAGGARVELPPNVGPSFTGAGGLCATAEALARWTRALHAGRVLRPDLLAELVRPERVRAGYMPPYGFGLSMLPLAGRPAYSHAGADEGWGAWAAYLPEERITIAILGNRGWMWSTDLGVPMVRLMTGLGRREPLRRLELTQGERRALSGAFEDGLFEIALTAEADRLLLSNPAFGDPIELWKQAGGRFVAPLRSDTFSLRLVDGRPEFDWMEHRSYLVRRAPAPAKAE